MSANIIITGDFCPIKRIGNLVEQEKYNEIFGEFIEYSRKADLAITNLECPLTESNSMIEKTGPCIKASKKSIKALKYAGFNLVTLANNHIMDYGSEGLKTTISTCNKENINFVGANKNLSEARKPFITKINGIKIAIINFAENEFCTTTGEEYGANPLNLVSNFYDIQNTKKEVDQLFVIVHGGREHYQLPSPRIRENFRFFIDAGADVVISHHTHCYSGYEIYNKKHIFYGLGNFIFDYKKKYQKGNWTEGYAVNFIINKTSLDFKLIPYFQGRIVKPTLELMKIDDKESFNKKISTLNNIIVNDVLFKEKWKEYLKTQYNDYKALLLVQNNYIRKLMSLGLIPKVYFHSKKHINLLLNLLRCEAHREIMIETLNKKIK